jgi:hypothetical protein
MVNYFLSDKYLQASGESSQVLNRGKGAFQAFVWFFLLKPPIRYREIWSMRQIGQEMSHFCWHGKLSGFYGASDELFPSNSLL